MTKVWIFGDCPEFLTNNKARAEHVPHEYIAPALGLKTPVTNFFYLLLLSSLIPGLEDGYLWMSDDFYVLREINEDQIKKTRYIEDLGVVTNRGRGLWKDSLWRTHDLLKRLGYTGYNFETHTPTYLKKKWVLEAFCSFRDFCTEDRWYGMLGPTAVLNHAYKSDQMPLVHLGTEGLKVGFYNQPPTYLQITDGAEGKTFLNFDDAAFSPDMQHFLDDQFQRKSSFER